MTYTQITTPMAPRKELLPEERQKILDDYGYLGSLQKAADENKVSKNCVWKVVRKQEVYGTVRNIVGRGR